MRKKVLGIILSAVMALGITACGSSDSATTSSSQSAETSSSQSSSEEEATSEAKADYMFGLCMPETDSESAQYTCTLIPQQLAELGYGEDNVLIGSYQNDASKIADVIENFSVAGVDCALINPYSEADGNTAVALCEEYGIKSVVVGIETEYYDVFLTLDQVVYGEVLTQLCIDWIEETFPADQEVQVAILNMSGTTNIYERSIGFRNELEANCSQATIVADVDASNTEDSIAATENIITMYPDVNVILCVKDDFSIGAIEAFKGAGKTGDEYAIYGLDFNEQVGNALLDDTSIYRGSAYIDASGINCGEIMLQSANGELDSMTEIVYPIAQVTADNAEDALIGHGYEVDG